MLTFFLVTSGLFFNQRLSQTDSRVWEPLAKVLWQCLGLRVSGPYSQDEEKAYDMDDDEIEEEESGPESDEEA